MNYYINENLKVQLNYYYITHKDYNSLNVRVQLRF